MGARQFGARVSRLEDPALLAGAGRFVDDVNLPGTLSACFVRSPHAHARIRAIDTAAALALPGVHAVITVDDLPEPMRSERIPNLMRQSGHQDHAHPARARARRGLLRRRGNRRGDRRQSLYRRGCGGAGRDRLRRAGGRLRLPRCGQTGRAAGTFRHRRQRRGGRAHAIRRRGCGVRRRGARVRGTHVATSRRRHGAGNARRDGEPRPGERYAHRVVVDADAAYRPPHDRRPAGAKPRAVAHDRARRGRRLRPQGAVLCRGGGDRRRQR